jgi:hypothetical protein
LNARDETRDKRFEKTNLTDDGLKRNVMGHLYLAEAGVITRQEKVGQVDRGKSKRARKSIQYIKTLQINKHRSANVPV